jgi:dihydroorotate dehydrogenase
MAEALARTDDIDRASFRPTYRTDRSFEWNYENGPDFDGPWPEVPDTPLKTFFGMPVRARYGVAASILVNSRWIGTYARLGFDILTYKTVRSVARLCHAPPNLLFLDDDSVAATIADAAAPAILAAKHPRDPLAASSGGSFGIPSIAPERWQPDIAAAKRALGQGQVLIVSVVGTAQPGLSDEAFIDDFAGLAGIVSANGADAVEVDLSCPNVARREGEVFLDFPLAARIARAVKSAAGGKPVLLKVGEFPDAGKIEAFLDRVAGDADGVVMMNAPSRRILDRSGAPAFGAGRERAGVTGGAIKSIALRAVETAAAVVAKRRSPLKIIGVGGVACARDVRDFLNVGAYAAQSATAAAWNPGLAAAIKAEAPEI